MGLRYLDLDSWRRWQASKRRAHVLKDQARALLQGRSQPQLRLRWFARGTDPQVLVACDSDSPTNRHALLAPLAARPDLDALVVGPEDVDLSLPRPGWLKVADPDDLLPGVQTVTSIGDHLPVGAYIHQLARERGWQQLVVQHGLLTPFSPPPPPGATVLAWSQADADFLSGGRPDLDFRVVGSALLTAAALNRAAPVNADATPVFLGQLHGAELSRASMTASVTRFWRMTGARYRPHPSEHDKLSRLQHQIWRRMGMEVDAGGGLAGLSAPVVSAFSTGVLEAAAMGVPAWVFHLNPPAWLEEFWQRYDMNRWGGEPTSFRPAPEDPASTIAEQLIRAEPGR